MIVGPNHFQTIIIYHIFYTIKLVKSVKSVIL